MGRSILLIAVFASMVGCSSQAQIAEAAAHEKAKQSSDRLLNRAIWYKCEGAFVGAIRRHYDTAERAKQWTDECGDRAWSPGPPLAPENELGQ
jgi:hypothetical protein